MGRTLLFGVVLLQILAVNVCFTHAKLIDVPRRTFGGRALRATPYGKSPPATPSIQNRFQPFANKGGPPDVQGVWTGDRYIGILPPGDGFVSTIYLAENSWMQQMGRYLSWECTSQTGVYQATTIREDTYSNGTIEYRQRCEVGKVDLDAGVYYWKSSAEVCPDPNDSTNYNTPLKRVKNSNSIPGVKSLYCTGNNPGAGFTNIGKAGLDKIRPEGVYNGEALPPPLDPNAPFPPKFSNPSGPNDISGIWYSDSSRTGELIDQKGSFSSVAYLPDDTFMSVLGRFNSNNCTGAGMYSGSITFTQTFQDLKRVSANGCTSGAVDIIGETYTWAAADPGKCPDKKSMSYTLNRAATSEALPAATTYEC
jgi:hypothetical protein